MNEFTKKELELLKFCILRCKLYDKQFDSLFDNLDQSLEKLQSMIDNYCEHEYIGCIEGITAMPYCNKCRRAIP